MKTKMLLMVVVLLGLALIFAGCGQQKKHYAWTMCYAEIALPDGEVVQGPVVNYKTDYSLCWVDIQIGQTVYRTHCSNVVITWKME